MKKTLIGCGRRMEITLHVPAREYLDDWQCEMRGICRAWGSRDPCSPEEDPGGIYLWPEPNSKGVLMKRTRPL